MARGLLQLFRAFSYAGHKHFGCRNFGSSSPLSWTFSNFPIYRHNQKNLSKRHVLSSLPSVQYCTSPGQQHSHSAPGRDWEDEDLENEERGEPRAIGKFPITYIPSEDIVNDIRTSNPSSNEEWQNIKTKYIESCVKLSNENIDGVLMNLCRLYKLFEMGDSLLNSIKESGEQPNISTLSNYLRLCYECEAGDPKTVSDICDQIRKEYPVMDPMIAERLIYGLTMTSKWEEGIELLSTVELGSVPTTGSYNALAKAAFDHGDLQKGWELLDQLVKAEKLPLPEVYKAWIRRCDQVRGEEASVMVAQLLNFWADYDLRPTFDVAMDLRRHFERENYSWEGCFTELTPRGSCKECSTMLRNVKIQTSEFDALREYFFKNVMVNSSIFFNSNPDELETFQQFLRQTAPYDIVIDGLNVAYIPPPKHNVDRAKFLADVVKNFVYRNKKILVLGRRHMEQWSRGPMNYIHEHASVFLAQNLSRDDPFLLYAAMYSGPRTQILSRDLMRSHIYLLKEPALKRVFKRWQQQQQVHLYMNRETGLVIKPPLHFNPSVQQGPGGVWHVPYDQTAQESARALPPQHWLCLQTKEHAEHVRARRMERWGDD